MTSYSHKFFTTCFPACSPSRATQPPSVCPAITAVLQPGRDLGLGTGRVRPKHPIALWIRHGSTCCCLVLVGDGPEAVSYQRQASYSHLAWVPSMS